MKIFGLIYLKCPVQMLMCNVHLLNDGRVLLFFAFNFLYHIPNLIHWCMAIQFRNKITPGSVPIFFQCPSSFRPEDAKIAEVVRCWMFSEPSLRKTSVDSAKLTEAL